MDFFERQDKARRGTKKLVVLFGAGVIALTLAVYVAVLLIFSGLDIGGSSKRRSHSYDYGYGYVRPSAAQSGLWNPQMFLASAAGTLAVVFLGAMFKKAELSKGGSAVATMLGGTLVNSNTKDLDERKLLNVVEEMSLAAGVPVPQVYILNHEQGINAFAAGYALSDAAIGVTRGAVRLLNRDELQGVIAHEFSHIFNGDMRLNMRLMGTVFGILCLTIIGRVLVRTRGRKNPLPLLGLALIIIGWIGVFFGQLIQAAVSRQREHLADASAVQFTRNPLGLASALKKIGGLAQGSRLTAPQAAEASHMFFGNGLRTPFIGLLATHPPLVERIRLLDPSFDGKFPLVADTALPPLPSEKLHPLEAEISGLFGQHWEPLRTPAPPMITPRAVVSAVGTPRPAHLRYAAALRNSFPEAITLAAREPAGAAAVVFALLLSDNEQVRQKQLHEITIAMSPAMVSEAERLFPLARQATISARLPVIDLVLPALRQLSPRQFGDFRTAVEKMVEADGEIDLFEYVLQKVLLRHLEPSFTGARKPVVQYYSLLGLLNDCGVLLSGLARVGSDSDAESERAFMAGAQSLAYVAQANIDMVPPESCGLDMMDAALTRISQAVPQIKKNVLQACALTVSQDGLIKEEEAELLRAVADSLDCPMPPLIAEAAWN
jgi:Zn-dependent protease with chaperone function